ncbi:MAG: alpha/beta fold hydrolase [Burkholderiaceae bacterium]
MSIDTLAQVADLERRARRIETPCGDAAMVWHTWGEADAAPVVLLHGGSGSWTHWVRNIDALVAAGRRVWIPDLPGFGDSAPPPAGGDADAVALPVAQGLQTLLGDAVVDVVGFSFGGMVATFVAVAQPARVRRLVLVGAPALGIAVPRPILMRGWTHLTHGAARDAAIRANLAALMFADPGAIDAFAIALQEHNVDRDRLRRRRLSRTDAILRHLPQVQAQVHGIWGERDALYVGHIDRIEPVLRLAPGFASLQVIESAGHWVAFEAAPRFDAALEAALSVEWP